METLKELSNLLSSLEVEALELTKSKSALVMECDSLKSRRIFLQGQIKKTEELHASETKKLAKLRAAAVAFQKKAQLDLNALDTKTDQKKQAYDVNFSELDGQLSRLRDEKRELEGQISTAQADLKTCDQNKQSLDDAVFSATNKIKSLKTEIDALSTKLEDKKQSTKDSVIALDVEASEANHRLDNVLAQIDKANSEVETVRDVVNAQQHRLIKAEKRHRKLIVHERDVIAKLEARSTALDERERQLEVRINTSRRRQATF